MNATRNEMRLLIAAAAVALGLSGCTAEQLNAFSEASAHLGQGAANANAILSTPYYAAPPVTNCTSTRLGNQVRTQCY